MKHKGLALAAVWLLMAALAVIYTDREAYTWRLEGESLSRVLETQAAAQTAQRAADEALAAEQQEARERSEAGLWGKEKQYADAPTTRPALGEEAGMNLMWGEYEVTVRYASETPLALRVVSAGFQAFIEGGEAQLAAAPQGAEETLRFTLTDSTPNLMLACDVPEGARVERAVVRRVCQRVCSPDLAVFAVLAGGVLSWLLVLSWDTRPQGVKRRRDAMILVCAALFASAPALMDGLFWGHDMFFHLNRIEGIASALRCGQFPARIHAATLLGYGYPAPEFYPELFFYVPALLRNLGVSMTACVQSLQIVINLAAALTCYAAARRILGSREVAVCASVLYTLSVYRLVNLYVRATFGESLAMVFFPLLIAAMADVLTRDERRWPMLALAMTGVFMSHMLSTLFAVGFCALAAICCLPRLVREPRRILACAKAAGLTVLCSLWFVVPFVQYTLEGISTNVGSNTPACVQPLGSLLTAFPNALGGTPKVGLTLSGAMGTQPGAALLLGCALLLLSRYMRDGKQSLDPCAQGRAPLAMLAMGALAVLMTTSLVPWARLCSMSAPLSTPFIMLQFPWRLMSVAVPLLCMAGACGYLARPRWARAGAVLALALSVVCSGFVLREVINQSLYMTSDSYMDTRIEMYEYTYVGTEKSAFGAGDVRVQGADAQVLAFEKHGTNLTLTLAGAEGAQYVEVPVSYYPGYRAQIDGEACSVRRGENNVIRLYGAWTGETSTVQVWFEEPVVWRAAELASLAGFALLIALCKRKRT